MKNIRIIITIALIVTVALASAFINISDDYEIKTRGNLDTAGDKGFAVVELFTSEGCSSCPPADALIEKLEKEIGNKPVYILAYHVDYWDRLGWKDPFSKAEYSKRQNTYADWLKLSSVYTPQVVVNGKTEFVGSKEISLRNSIATNLKTPAKSELSLTNIKVAGNKVLLSYETDVLFGKCNLLLALVQKNATINVKNGENGGRTLSHVQIVSNIQNIQIDAKMGEASINLPGNFSVKNYEIIAFVQNTMTGAINAATKGVIPLNQ